MKQILLFCSMLIGIQSFSQQRMNTAEDYTRKSRKLRTAGWILAGSGFTMVAAGTVLAINTNWDELDYNDNYSGRRETVKAVGAVALIGTGIVASLGSIPVFIISAKNKRTAASMVFSTERYPQLFRSSIVNAPMPALSLKIRF